MATPNILVSYIPLLYSEPGINQSKEQIEKMKEALQESDLGNAKGAVWSRENGEAVLTLVIDKAAEIVNHLNMWSEGKPEEWFTFQVVQNEGGYGISIMPELEKSFERFRIQNGLSTNFDAKQVQIFFRPLVFLSKATKAYDMAKSDIKDKIRVYLIDSELVNIGKFSENQFNFRVEIGNLKVVVDGFAKLYLESMIKEMH